MNIRLNMLALVLILFFGLAALPVAAQGDPTAVPTAEPTLEPTAAPTLEATLEATAVPTLEATAEIAATRFPPCPNPDAPNLSTPAESTAAPTESADSTAENTDAATPPAEFTPGYLGIAGETFEGCGTLITEVIAASPAETAGLQVGDVITGVDQTAFAAVDTLRAFITGLPVGAQIEIVVRREGVELIVPATLGERPALPQPTVKN